MFGAGENSVNPGENSGLGLITENFITGNTMVVNEGERPDGKKPNGTNRSRKID